MRLFFRSPDASKRALLIKQAAGLSGLVVWVWTPQGCPFCLNNSLLDHSFTVMYTHLMYALIAVALYFIYKRFTLYLRYLNFQITVLQRMILEPLYDERERIRGLIEKDNDPDWVRIGVDKEDEVTNQIKDRFMKAIDKTLDEDNNAQTAIKAIRVSGRLEIFDTVFPLYQIFSSDIEKRFKARHSKPQF